MWVQKPISGVSVSSAKRTRLISWIALVAETPLTRASWTLGLASALLTPAWNAVSKAQPSSLGSQGHSIGAMLRVVSIAAVLGALVTLAAEHRTQAQNVPGVIFADAFAPNSSMKSEEDQRDFGYVEGRYIGENSAGKISSAGGSGGRSSEMSPEEFAKFYHPLLDWIRTRLSASMHIAKTV